MRVLLSTYGSRGDVQPLAGLAAGLLALGAEVAVCAPPDEDFAELLARSPRRCCSTRSAGTSCQRPPEPRVT